MNLPLLLLALALADGTPTATTEQEEATRRCEALRTGAHDPFAVRHLLALERLRDWVSPGTVEECLDGLASASGLPDRAKRAVAALRATQAWDAGDDEPAAGEAQRAGAWTAWEAAGPFTDPRRSPLSGGGTVEDAVAALRAGETGPLPGRHGPVEFHALPAPRSDGVIDLARALPLTDGSCALMRGTVDVPAARDPRLLLGGAPELTVWIEPRGDGAESEPATTPAARDGTAPERFSVVLPAGRRQVEVWIGACPESGPALLRIALGYGETDVEHALRTLAGEGRAPAPFATRLAAAELLVEAGALPATSDPLSSAFLDAPPEQAGAVALLQARAGVTPTARQAAAARALVLRPDDIEALLAVVADGAGLPGRPGVGEAFVRLVDVVTGSSRAAVALAREHLANGLPLTALADLRAPAGEGAGAPIGVLRVLADTDTALGRTDERQRTVERILIARPRDVPAWTTRVDGEIAAARYDAVREWLAAPPFVGQETSEEGSAVPSLALERLATEALLRMGDVDAALARLERLAAERPADETAWFDLGWALARAGREEDAERALRRGLALRPTDALARSWVAAREAPDPEVERWLGRGEDVAARVDAARDAFPEADVVVAFRSTVVSVQASGGVREWHRRIVAAATQAGADRLGSLPLASFDPSRTVFRLTRAEVRGGDGRTLGGATVTTSGVDIPDVRLYTPLRLASLSLPRLAAGDVIEVEFELTDIGPSPLPEGALAREFPVRDVDPTALLRVVGVVPEDLVPRVDAPADVDGRTEEGVSGDRRFVAWEAHDLPAVPAEPWGPPLRELSGAVRLTTFASWTEVGEWIARLFRPRPGERGIADLVEGRELPGIYREVASSVRYVAAEYGSHGLEPAPPSVTLARGFGDCKDKVALLLAALEQAGIDAQPALVRSRFAGADPSGGAFPFPFAFDHVVAYLPPPIDRYVDPTATRLPWDVLPRSDRGATGLLLAPEGPQAVMLPAGPPESEGVERRDLLFFDPTGEAALIGEFRAGGADAADFRELLAAPDLRAGVLAVLLDRELPDVEIVAVDLEGLEPDAAEFRAGYVGSVPGLAQATPDGLAVPLGVRFDLVSRFAPLERHTSDVELSAAGFPIRWRRDVQIGLTGSWSWSELPPDVREMQPFGSFSLMVRDEGGMLHVSVDLSIDRQRIAASEYLEFRSFLARVDAAVAQQALAVRRAPGE